MNNTVVIYASNYGHTQKYAEYIAEQLDCEAISVKNFKPERLDDYDTVIFGSGVYAGKMTKADFINRNSDILRNRKLIIFTVCLTQARTQEDKLKIESYLNDNINSSVDVRKHFNLPGGINHDRLNFIHSMMMKMAKLMMREEVKKDTDNVFGKNHDFTDLNKANEIIEYIRNL